MKIKKTVKIELAEKIIKELIEAGYVVLLPKYYSNDFIYFWYTKEGVGTASVEVKSGFINLSSEYQSYDHGQGALIKEHYFFSEITDIFEAALTFKFGDDQVKFITSIEEFKKLKKFNEVTVLNQENFDKDSFEIKIENREYFKKEKK